MAQAGSDELFDDADLDDLPPNTYQELEQRARLSTQQGAPIAYADQHTVGRLKENDYTSAGTERGGYADVGDVEGPPSSDYGLDDEDVVDLDRPLDDGPITSRLTQHVPPRRDEVGEREQWRQQRYGVGALPQHEQHKAVTPVAVPHRQAYTEKGLDRQMQSNGVPPQGLPDNGSNTNISVLQARIAELEEAHADLRKANDEAKAASFAKAGEIAIVRANQDRVTKDYESKMAALQRHQAEEATRHRAELESARKERGKVETNSKFLEHDLAQETERARNAERTLNGKQVNTIHRTGKPSPLSTPQKAKNLPFRDGFDDGEVVMISPSKSKGKSKASTPTKAGGKRKRNLQQAESPVRPLSFTEPDPLPIEQDSPQQQPELTIELPIRPAQDASGELVDFTQMILNHQTRSDTRTMEALTARSFPSNPSVSLASFIYDSLKLVPPRPSIEEFRIRVCNALSDLWSQCLDEKCYTPLREITDIFQDVLLASPVALSSSVASRAVPLCLAATDLIAVPRAKASKNPNLPQETDPDIESNIKPYDHLELLHLLALHCQQEGKESISFFWSTMEHDFVLLMLARAQPLSQITLMLHVLGTSVLETSFGAIANTARHTNNDPTAIATRQAKTEYEIVSRLTVLLFDIPEPPKAPQGTTTYRPPVPTAQTLPNEDTEPGLTSTGESYTPTALLSLRTTILSLLKQIVLTTHGLHAFTSHRLALGRLVRFLHESVLALYSCAPATHAQTTHHVNESTLLLAHVTSTASSTGSAGEGFDLRARLATEPGGAYKHLVALGRVAFAEGASEIEKGIEPEVAEAAHCMLDEILSPEEGEAVVAVFGGGR